MCTLLNPEPIPLRSGHDWHIHALCQPHHTASQIIWMLRDV